tara:strand:+ start:2309 stop:2686 length:378 start_codon:yes stop_codon:yes gene_type:complete
MLYSVVLFVFVIVCVLLVGIILLQSSQSGGMGSALAGNTLNSAFGGQGADRLLVKTTTFLAVTFMCLAILLSKPDWLSFSSEKGATEQMTSSGNTSEPEAIPKPIDSDESDIKKVEQDLPKSDSN